MTAILKRECKNYLKNPFLWLGLLIIIFGIYQEVSPYLGLRYFQSDAEIAQLTPESIMDADILEGYIPTGREEQFALGYQKIKQQLIKEFDYSAKEAEDIIQNVKEKQLSPSELDAYFSETYQFFNAKWYILESEIRQGTADEANAYIRQKLAQHPYSYYFARKFADFGGLYMGFYAGILLAFLYFRDTRKDTYELMHTKPISAIAYISGKILGGFLSMLGVLVILNLVFGILCQIAADEAGFPIRWQDLPAASLLYIVPNLFMITCVYTIAAVIFKNPLPAIPLLFLHMVYSNMGSRGPDGEFGYYGRLFAIMVRFPGRFFDTVVPPLAPINQPLLIITSILLIIIASMIWKRRRVY